MTIAAAPAPRLRIGDSVVLADDATGIAAAVTAHNNRARIPLLEDALNPFLLDPAKVGALIAALPGVTLPPVGEAALYFNSPDLPLRPTSPVALASFASLREVMLVEIQGRTALLRAGVAVDCAAAAITAEAARGGLSALEPDRNPALGPRRFALALAWNENAAAVKGCKPDDAAAAMDQTAAKAAVSRYAVPTGGLP